MVRPLLRLSRFRPSSLVLGTALVFALGGLYAGDRTLARSVSAQVSHEATVAAGLVESFLAVHAQALLSLSGLYLGSPGGTSDADVRALVRALTERAPSFRRLWTTDAGGVIQHQFLFHSTRPLLPAGLDIDTLRLLDIHTLARRARQTRRLQLSAPAELDTGERGFVLLAPVFVGERFAGFVGGAITSRAMLEHIMRRHRDARTAVLVLAGNDTVGRSAAATAPYTASSTVDVPGGGRWRVAVARAETLSWVRLALWAFGLATLVVVLVTLAHERRQARRLAERSAELERLSRELLRANRSKSEFLANVSHEFRTPLNAIVGFVELLRDGVYGELAPRQISPVERIASSANHLRHLVDQVLDIAKIAAGRLEVHPEPVDLRPFVLDVASEVEALVSERGLNLSVAISASLPRVRTDPAHLRQILVNLLGNAVKYTPSGGIAVRARLVSSAQDLAGATGVPATALTVAGGAADSTRWIALQVADTGIGIAPEDHERIFEEFEQVNAGPRGDSMRRGTGLGLAISRRLARLLGGDIVVESELGRGSTFTVWLPVDAAEQRRRTSSVVDAPLTRAAR